MVTGIMANLGFRYCRQSSSSQGASAHTLAIYSTEPRESDDTIKYARFPDQQLMDDFEPEWVN